MPKVKNNPTPLGSSSATSAKASSTSLDLSFLSSAEASLITELIAAHPSFRFKNGSKFAFRPPKTIILGPPQPNYALLTLHEAAHGLLNHKDYNTHVERLKIERAAWERAKTLFYELGFNAHLSWDQDFVEDQLDTYRDWLHTKSKRKNCGLTRFQTKNGHYHCPLCDR